MLNWIDATRYAKDTTTQTPTILKCNVTSDVEMRVYQHIDYGEEWLLSCAFVGLDKFCLHTEDLVTAKEIAKGKVKFELRRMESKINAAIAQLEIADIN